MTRAAMFNSPLLLGFDQLERALDRMNKSAGDGYPPYNVEQIDEGHLRITLAVAGFSERDLSVQIENNQLVIRGKQEPEAEDRVFLHRGIAARQFQRAFVLADGIEVQSARLNNGLLHIDLQRPIETPSVRRITIEKDSGARSPLDSKKLP
ncbi:MAG TPA: Hsp20 family protein [Kiloniellales bacterium]|nr:Hsp20 family protein [Kiloniellales bacterium]